MEVTVLSSLTVDANTNDTTEQINTCLMQLYMAQSYPKKPPTTIENVQAEIL